LIRKTRKRKKTRKINLIRKKMAMLKNKELRTINPRELKTKLEELRKELIKLNVQKSTGTSAKNPKQIKIIKKTIARILTLLQKKYKKLEKKPEGEK